MAYRGTSAAPIQPYAFSSTPGLAPNGQWQQYPAYRASSSSAVPTMQSFDPNNGFGRSRHHQNASLPNLSNSAMAVASGGSRDDFALPPPGARRNSPVPRPQSAAYLSSPTAPVSLGPAPSPKSQPDRYRRSAQRTDLGTTAQGSAGPSGSGMASVSHLYQPQPSPTRERRPSGPSRPNSFSAKMSGSVDDMQLYRNQAESKRVRRRSMPALESADLQRPLAPLDTKRSEEAQSAPKGATDKEHVKTARVVAINSSVTNSSAKNGSSESLASSRSSNSPPSSVSVPICSQAPDALSNHATTYAVRLTAH